MFLARCQADTSILVTGLYAPCSFCPINDRFNLVLKGHPCDNSVPEAGGYPDFIQDSSDPAGADKIYIMETNKKVCRLHLIPGKNASTHTADYYTRDVDGDTSCGSSVTDEPY